MKDISATLLVSGFVLFALISLLTAIHTPESSRLVLNNNQERVSELGLRFALTK